MAISSSLIVVILGEQTPPNHLILVPVNPRNVPPPTIPLQQEYISTCKARPPTMTLMSHLYWLPNELIIAIATLLDAPSLVRFESVRPFFLPLISLLHYQANLILDM